MRFTFLFLLATLIITSCNPGFHRQKHTNFAHIKALKWKERDVVLSTEVLKSEHQDETPEFVAENIHASLAAEDSFALEGKPEASPVTIHFPDTLSIQPEDSLKTAALTASDSLSSMYYVRQLKREAKRNLIIGAVEIGVGVLAFLFLPYWLPILIIHSIVGVILLLIASHKGAKANDLKNEPGKYENPAGKYKFSNSLAHLSNVGYALLFLGVILGIGMMSVVIAGTLWYGILAIVFLYLICVPLTIIGLLLLLIAAIKGRNYTRKENLEWVDTDHGATVRWYNAFNWSIIAIAFTGIVTGLSKLFSKE